MNPEKTNELYLEGILAWTWLGLILTPVISIDDSPEILQDSRIKTKSNYLISD